MAKLLRGFAPLLLLLLPLIVEECEAKNIIELTRMGVFKVAVLRNQKPVVVYFTKRSCNQCKQIQNDLEALARANDGKMMLAIADIDQYPDLRKEFEIGTVPTTRTYFKGELLREVEGPLAGGIRAISNNAIKYGEQHGSKKS